MFTKNNLIRLFFCKHQHGGKIVGIKFYTVSDEYIDYCRKIEKKVPKNVDESTGFKKPHIGIMIQNSEHNYFVPLTSNKERYDHFREDYTFHFIRDLSYIDKQNPDNEKKIAGLRIGYMFPVPECALQPLEFNSIEDKEYKVEATDVIIVPPNKRFYYLGNMKQVLINSPAWEEETDELLRKIPH